MRTLSTIKYVFTALGMLMLVGAFFFAKSTYHFIQTAQHAEGTVTELVRSSGSGSGTYAPIVEFETEAGAKVEFRSSVSSNPPAYDVGEVVEVLYQSEQPQDAKINGFFSVWGGALILGILGTVFFSIGASLWLFGAAKIKKAQRLKSQGMSIIAKFQSVQRNTGLEVNGANPYQIYAQWMNPATQKLHVFKSDNIWFDPSDYIASEDIKVFVERGNPKSYSVDISFLPEMAE